MFDTKNKKSSYFHKLVYYIIFFCGIVFFISSSAFAQDGRGRFRVLSASIWPKQTYLGRIFVYRAKINIPIGYKIQKVTKKQYGIAHQQGVISLRKTDKGMILRVPLVIYVLSRFGGQKIPSFYIKIRNNLTVRRIILPSRFIKIRARCDKNSFFREAQKSERRQLYHVSKKEEPSHDFSLSMPIRRDKLSILFWVIVISFLLVVMISARYWRIHRLKEPEVVIITPYEEAQKILFELSQKNQRGDGEVSSYYQIMIQTIRHYLEKISSVPATKLTTNEWVQQTNDLELPWKQQLVDHFQENDRIRFTEQWPDYEQTLRIIQETQELLKKIHQWHLSVKANDEEILELTYQESVP